MEDFLAQIQTHLDREAPDLRPIFDKAAFDARFGYEWLGEDIKRLRKGCAILEVGGGAMILACQLMRDGFVVTVVEPDDIAFRPLEPLRAIVLQLAKLEDAEPNIVVSKAENFLSTEQFDYAYSLNAMHFVEDVDNAITRVSAVLKHGATFRFFCPNYCFPYEPEFRIPAFWTKNLTEKLMGRRIKDKARWDAINWITVAMVNESVSQDASLALHFNRKTVVKIFSRRLKDEAFIARRHKWLQKLLRFLAQSNLYRLAAYLPAHAQPFMDVRLIKRI